MRFGTSRAPGIRRVPHVPIHLRANPGDYAEACLLPGDPLRAKHIAETFLTDVVQVNAERGLLGYTGRWEDKPVSVQGTGMGCPSATIVFEELIQLGVKRLLRVGTCGGLQPDHALGDLIVAISAIPLTTSLTEPSPPTTTRRPAPPRTASSASAASCPGSSEMSASPASPRAAARCATSGQRLPVAPPAEAGLTRKTVRPALTGSGLASCMFDARCKT